MIQMANKIVVEGELCSLNEYINAERRNRFIAAKIKKEETALCEEKAKEYKIMNVPCALLFVWYVKNARKDADNIVYSKKYVLDGLVRAGALQNDTQKYVRGFADIIKIDKERPRVEIHEIPLEELDEWIKEKTR